MHVIKLPANIEQLEFVNKKLSEILTDDLSPLRQKVQLLVEELLVNICNYAYEGAGEVQFGYGIVTFDGEKFIRITFIDQGKPFNPFAEREDIDTESPVESRAIGGLGIHLVKTLATHYMYTRYGDEKNVVDIFISTLKK